MPPIILEVQVNAQGVVTGLRTVDQAVADTTKHVQQTSQATDQAASSTQHLGQAARDAAQGLTQTKSAVQASRDALYEAEKAASAARQETQGYSQSLGASAQSALTFATSLIGVQLGISTIGSVVQSTASAVLDFSAAMANVNTIAGRSREVQEQLRQEVLKLPPELLSSTEAAKGLYDVISAGIEPTKAVAFLADAAKLAKAGLADMGTTVEALTKSMTAYNIPADKAGQVSDILFKTVELGQGTLNQFAHALPQVTQLSASLGVSFVETNAIMATLSQTFRSADTAATGYRSLLAQLVQNSDEFAAAGVNIQQVIGEQGFTGVLRVLQTLTGGNSEKMKRYVNDVEGLSAAIALTGPQYQLLLDNQKKYAESLGVTERAVKLQTETTKASLSALTNAFTTYVTVAVGADNSTSLFTKTLKLFTDAFAEHSKGILEAEQKAAAWRAEQERSRKATEASTQAIDERAAADQASLKAFADTTFAYLKQGQEAQATAIATEQLAEQYRTAASEADNMAMSATGLDNALTKNGTSMSAAAKETQQLSVDLLGLQKNLATLRVGEQPKLLDAETLDRSIKAATASLERLAKSGQVSFSEIIASVEALEQAIKERLGTVPPEVQTTFDTIRAAGAKSAEGLRADFQRFHMETRADLQQTALRAIDAFQRILASGKATPEQLIDAYLDMVDTINKGGFQQLPEQWSQVNAGMVDIARKAGVDLATPYRDAAGDIVLSFKTIATAIDTSLLQTRGALERANQATKDLTYSTEGLSEKSLMLGHAITSLGEEVNAYGNAVAKTTEQTQKLLDLQINVKTPFATNLEGLQKQLQQANADLLALGRRIPDLGYEGYKQQQKVLTDLIATLEQKIADLKKTASSATGTGTGGTTGMGTGSGGTTAPTSTTIRPTTGTGLTGGGVTTTTGPTTTTVTGPTNPTATQRSVTYNVTVQTQAQDAATLARDLVPYLRQADLSRRTLGG